MEKVPALILAAGKSTRMGTPKLFRCVDGKPMLERVWNALSAVPGVEPIAVVKGEQAQKSYPEMKFVQQGDEFTGTGAAVIDAVKYLERTGGLKGRHRLLVVHVDEPNVTPESYRRVIDCCQENPDTKIGFATARVKDFAGWRLPFQYFGRVLRNSRGELAAIVEVDRKAASGSESLTDVEVNAAIYCFDLRFLLSVLSRIREDSVSGELNLTSSIQMAVDEGKRVRTVLLPPEEVIGFNTEEDIERFEAYLSRKRIREESRENSPRGLRNGRRPCSATTCAT